MPLRTKRFAPAFLRYDPRCLTSGLADVPADVAPADDCGCGDDAAPSDDPYGPDPAPTEPDPGDYPGDMQPFVPLPPAYIGPAGPAF